MIPVQSAVSVLGLGPMGRALATAFRKAGVSTTVWNRTPGKDRDVVELGAISATTPEEAVAASDLTVICVVDYDAVDAILRRPAVTADLQGRTVVNLTADTPDRARETAAWAATHAIRYLDGAIMTPTPSIGTPAAVFLHSGPEQLYRHHEPVLDALGGTHTHLGEDIGRAAAYDIALLDIFWTAMAGYAHALAIARAEGITAGELAPFAQGIGAILPPIFAQGAAEADRGEYPGDGNPITSALSSISHIVRTAAAHGLDTSLPRTAERLAQTAVDQGFGTDGFLRVTELIGVTRNRV